MSRRSLQGAEGWTANRTRCDASYDVSTAASRMRVGTVGDLRGLNKTLKYVKSTQKTRLHYPHFPEGQKLRLLGVCDLFLLNMEDGKSQRGVLISLTEDRPSNHGRIVGHLLNWEGRKGARIARSSLAAGTHAAQECTSLLVWVTDLFEEFEGYRLPADVRIDAEPLASHLKTDKKTNHLRLHWNIAQLKEDVRDERVRTIKHVEDEDTLADPLTKKVVAKKKKEALRYAIVTGTVTRLD